MKRPDPVEIVAIGIPLLVEAVVVLFAIAVAAMWIGIIGGIV
jgi:hypothetical protein